jgi:hypothetical protein
MREARTVEETSRSGGSAVTELLLVVAVAVVGVGLAGVVALAPWQALTSESDSTGDRNGRPAVADAAGHWGESAASLGAISSSG